MFLGSQTLIFSRGGLQIRRNESRRNENAEARQSKRMHRNAPASPFVPHRSGGFAIRPCLNIRIFNPRKTFFRFVNRQPAFSLRPTNRNVSRVTDPYTWPRRIANPPKRVRPCLNIRIFNPRKASSALLIVSLSSRCGMQIGMFFRVRSGGFAIRPCLNIRIFNP